MSISSRRDRLKNLATAMKDGMAGMATAEFDESKHPRAKDGKFGEGGGGSKSRGDAAWEKEHQKSGNVDKANKAAINSKTHESFTEFTGKKSEYPKVGDKIRGSVQGQKVTGVVTKISEQYKGGPKTYAVTDNDGNHAVIPEASVSRVARQNGNVATSDKAVLDTEKASTVDKNFKFKSAGERKKIVDELVSSTVDAQADEKFSDNVSLMKTMKVPGWRSIAENGDQEEALDAIETSLRESYKKTSDRDIKMEYDELNEGDGDEGGDDD